MVTQKRGEMSMVTLVGIIIAVVVLVVVVYGFTSGWDVLWDKIMNIANISP